MLQPRRMSRTPGDRCSCARCPARYFLRPKRKPDPYLHARKPRNKYEAARRGSGLHHRRRSRPEACGGTRGRAAVLLEPTVSVRRRRSCPLGDVQRHDVRSGRRPASWTRHVSAANGVDAELHRRASSCAALRSARGSGGSTRSASLRRPCTTYARTSRSRGVRRSNLTPRSRRRARASRSHPSRAIARPPRRRGPPPSTLRREYLRAPLRGVHRHWDIPIAQRKTTGIGFPDRARASCSSIPFIPGIALGSGQDTPRRVAREPREQLRPGP